MCCGKVKVVLVLQILLKMNIFMLRNKIELVLVVITFVVVVIRGSLYVPFSNKEDCHDHFHHFPLFNISLRFVDC